MNNKRLEHFLDFIDCIYKIDFTVIDADGNSNKPFGFNEMFVEKDLSSFYSNSNKSIIYSNEYNIGYIIVPDKNRNLYFLGPFSGYEINEKHADKILDDAYFNKYTIAEKINIRNKILKLPIIDYVSSIKLAAMLFYAINGEKISLSDVIYENKSSPSNEKNDNDPNYYFCYQYEKQIMEDIRDGHPDNYKRLFKFANSIKYRLVYPADSVRSRKNLSLFGLALLNNAAIDGGLDLAIAYGKQKYYTTLIENTKSVAKIADIDFSMYEDYANSVKKVKNERYNKSDFVIKIETHIMNNIDDDISLDSIANYFNLSSYYLSKRFYKETKIRLKDFINKKKIEEAKNRLLYTNDSVALIADSLHFVNASYFSQLFKKEVGLTPTQYRTNNNSNSTSK